MLTRGKKAIDDMFTLQDGRSRRPWCKLYIDYSSRNPNDVSWKRIVRESWSRGETIWSEGQSQVEAKME